MSSSISSIGSLPLSTLSSVGSLGSAQSQRMQGPPPPPHGPPPTEATDESDVLSMDDILEDLADAVENGTITQEQSDAIQESLSSRLSDSESTEESEAATGEYAADGSMGSKKAPPEIEAVADKLGMSVDELGSALQSGSTLSDLATEAGTTEEELNEIAYDAAEESLTQAVSDGKMDQSMASEILSNIQSGNWLKAPHGMEGAQA